MWPGIPDEAIVRVPDIADQDAERRFLSRGEQIIPPVAVGADTPNTVGVERGIASWYRDRRTASGEPYRRSAYTAAHRTLPFGSRVRVRNLNNGREVVVRITDRGPFVSGRIIDLSEAAAREIGLLRSGTAPVEIEIIAKP